MVLARLDRTIARLVLSDESLNYRRRFEHYTFFNDRYQSRT